ncbi:hypothetical protein LEP1GSC108_2142 [Leptospira weilii str. UI 13098]|uniref:Uncharacterized protein n=1 Tax=Leptospira weilii str. UI 13098 TaxID=1088542 RepID=M6PZG9_9LEPT|nr:hypothetical protein LEP1GSC086_4314 [Leptospira weilii str. LNT 1234]EMN88449.1 hypothetical protein LEP1GSC108_2142 [Leptospira weilii str. UI 13098]
MSQNLDRNIITNFSQNEEIPTDYVPLAIYRFSNRFYCC